MVLFINKTPYLLRLKITTDAPTCVITSCTCPKLCIGGSSVGGGGFEGEVRLGGDDAPQVEYVQPWQQTEVHNTGCNYRVSVEYEKRTSPTVEYRGVLMFKRRVRVPGKSVWKTSFDEKSYNCRTKLIPFIDYKHCESMRSATSCFSGPPKRRGIAIGDDEDDAHDMA